MEMLSNVRSLNNLVGFHPGIRHYMKFEKFTWISTPPTTSPAIPDFTWKIGAIIQYLAVRRISKMTWHICNSPNISNLPKLVKWTGRDSTAIYNNEFQYKEGGTAQLSRKFKPQMPVICKIQFVSSEGDTPKLFPKTRHRTLYNQPCCTFRLRIQTLIRGN